MPVSTTPPKADSPTMKPVVKSVTITLLFSGPEVKFSGPYMQKRELELVVRAIRHEHKVCLREYRRKNIIAEYEAAKAANKQGDTTKETKDGNASKTQ